MDENLSGVIIVLAILFVIVLIFISLLYCNPLKNSCVNFIDRVFGIIFLLFFLLMSTLINICFAPITLVLGLLLIPVILYIIVS